MRLSSFVQTLALVVLTAGSAAAQLEGVQPLDGASETFLLRQQALGRLPQADFGVRPFSAYETNRWLDSLAASPDTASLTRLDRIQLDRLLARRPGPNVDLARRLVPGLYTDGMTAIAASGPDYRVITEPAFYVGGGPALGVADSALGRPTNSTAYRFSRGVRTAGRLGPAFFETTLLENQEARPWVSYQDQTAPKLSYTNLSDGGTYDYWDATGVVGVRWPVFEARFGRERQRWGPGLSSLMISGYAAPVTTLHLRADLGPVTYAATYAELVRPRRRPQGAIPAVFPRRYAAFHRVNVALGPVDLEVFETVVFADDSLAGNRSGFELSYLNPVLFLRAAETDVGASDNALIGVGAAWDVPGGPRLYGQVLLDEFRFGEIGTDWWGNKYGLLGGLRWADPGVGAFRLRNADLEVEAVTLRPYLYSHRIPDNALVHFGEGLGHPAGPNARDLTARLRVRPGPFTEAVLSGTYTQRGRNTATENFGSDPLLTYDTRVSDYGVSTLQGVRQNEILVEARLTQEVLPSVFVEIGGWAQSLRDAQDGRSSYVALLGQLRWGLPFRQVRQ